MHRPVKFGKYVLTDRLAVGGMAEVFKAKFYGVSGFEKPMVVKQILPQYADNPEFVTMFIEEAKTAVSLNHGNIVTVYELGRVDEVYFIAMEYVPGRDLAELVSAATSGGKNLSIEHAVFIANEICKGLEYAHGGIDSHGQPLSVVHRDITPANIMVSYSGEVKIADFGIAKALRKASTTHAGVVKGTYGYMSPQQVAGESIDHRADIFSTGILLYEMVTGERLFAAANELESLERVRDAEVARPSLRNTAVPAELDEIVLKALAKAPADRYPDAHEFQLSLSRFLFSSGRGATSTTLARYMRDLFPRQEAADGDEAPTPSLPDAHADSVMALEFAGEGLLGGHAMASNGLGLGVDDRTQSYAVRAGFSSDDPDLPSIDGLVPLAGDPATTGPPVHHEATLALPLVADEEDAPTGELLFSGPERRDRLRRALGAPGDTPETEQPRPRPPRLPDIPPLKIGGGNGHARGAVAPPAAPAPASPAPVQTNPLAGLFDDLPEQLRETPAESSRPLTGPPHLPTARTPGAAIEPPVAPTFEAPDTAGATPPVTDAPALLGKHRRGPRSDESVMALIMRPPTGEQRHVDENLDVALLAPHVVTEAPPAPQDATPAILDAPAWIESSGHATSHGSGNSAHAPGDTGRFRVKDTLSATASLFVQGLDIPEDPTLDRVPKIIKPTVLGWLLIGCIFAGSLAFVWYKRSKMQPARVDDQALLSLDDIRPDDNLDTAAQDAKGSIRLEATPAEAVIMLHVGDTPVKVEQLDLGNAHLLRIEREGYAANDRVVQPEQVEGDAPISVSLQPTGAGVQATMPRQIPSAEPSGRFGSVEVTSDPPSASVWRVLGRGSVHLPDLPAKRYYFKVMQDGHQTAFVSVSPAQFKQSDGAVAESVQLKPEAGVDATAPAPADASTSAEAAVAPKTAIQTGSSSKVTRSKAKRRRSKRRKSRRRSRRSKSRKGGGSLQLPNWAN